MATTATVIPISTAARIAHILRPGKTSGLLPRPWEAAVLLILLFILVAQLVVAPVVGMADNGDFPRIMGYFSVGYAPGQRNPSYFKYATVKFVVDPANRWASGFLSSELLLTAMAYLASRAAGEGRVFDIRFVGMTHALLLLAAVWLVLLWARRFPLGARVVLGGMLVLVFGDVSYVAYFNSFYSEPASLLFLLLIPPLAGFLLHALKEQHSRSERSCHLLLIAFVAVSLLFITAKPQNALAGCILALYVARMFPLGHGRVWRILTLLSAASLVLCAVVTYRGTSRIVRGSTMHIAVFSELLAHSATPERDLNELRLPASLMKYVGTHPWQWSPPTFDDPEFVRTFLAQIGMGRLALFYLHHPERLIRLFDRSAADALATRARLGNFEASTGAAPGALSERFRLWTNIKTALAPKTASKMLLVFGFLVLIAIAARVRVAPFDRPLVDLGIAMIAIAATQFATVAIAGGTIDTAKQMCLFRAIADLLVVACVSAAAVGLGLAWTRWANSLSRAGTAGQRRSP